MSEPIREEVLRLIDIHRPADALALVEDGLARDRDDVELQFLRVKCLVSIGQFERAIELGETILAHGNHPATRHQLEMILPALAPPPFETADPEVRPYRSSIPREALLSIQQAVHHYSYRGRQLVKGPYDLALYPMLLERERPGTIIEIGSKAGGSAIWFGDLMKRLGMPGEVHSYDLFPPSEADLDNVHFHRGDGQRLADVIDAAFIATLARPLVVIEDADHSFETTSGVLRFFHEHLDEGDYFVVEDGNLADIYPDSYPEGISGPNRAIREFLADHGDQYVIDARYCDFFGYNATSCTNGFLRRHAAGGVG